MEKLPVTYECKDKADNQRVSYHPMLPLVVVPGGNGPLFFNRESGDLLSDRIKLPKDLPGGPGVVDAYFSPDGKNVLLKMGRGTNSFLYKAPLRLSPEELEQIKKGVVHERPARDPGIKADREGLKA